MILGGICGGPVGAVVGGTVGGCVSWGVAKLTTKVADNNIAEGQKAREINPN